MPWKLHEKHYLVAYILIVASAIAFIASYVELQLLLLINNLVVTFAIVSLGYLVFHNHITSQLISSDMDTQCPFVMPSFSQETLMTHGCSTKYSSFSTDVTRLSCPPEDISLIWEDNINLLIKDQKENYGCLNLGCCDTLDIMISGRFSAVTATCIVLIIFLSYFIINQQYMIKKLRKYNSRNILNHHGDLFNAGATGVLVLIFLVSRFGVNYTKIGPPIAKFEPVVPRGNSIYSYYGLPNPKIKQEKQILEINRDPYMTQFRFNDLSKLLPYSESACQDGVCNDND